MREARPAGAGPNETRGRPRRLFNRGRTLYVAEVMGGSENKRQDIVDAAIRIFSKHGFHAASVNDIARDAGVSKRTLYKYFRSKIELFSAIVEYMARTLQNFTPPSSQVDDDPREALTRYARNYLDLVLSPAALDLTRMVIAESQRFPTLGSTFHSAGSRTGSRAFAAYVTKLRERGILDFKDAELLAEQFAALCLGQLRMRAYYDPSIVRHKAAIDYRIKSAVDLFLRGCGYNPRANASITPAPAAQLSRTAVEIRKERAVRGAGTPKGVTRGSDTTTRRPVRHWKHGSKRQLS